LSPCLRGEGSKRIIIITTIITTIIITTTTVAFSSRKFRPLTVTHFTSCNVFGLPGQKSSNHHGHYSA
jgi:hypothetical protein